MGNGFYSYAGPGNFAIYGHHLWYLFFLAIFSVVCLKLFLILRKEEHLETIKKIAAFFKKPGALFIFIIPLFLLQGFDPLEAIGIPKFGGWSVIALLIFFIFGYLFAIHEDFRESLRKHEKPALIISIIASIMLGIIFFEVFFPFSLELFGIFWVTNGWCWLILLLNLGDRYLNFNHPSRKFLNELVLPFYILHQTIIVVIGYYVVSWDMIILGKYLIISSLSFAIIFGLLLVIRKVNVLRVLFGMSLKKKKESNN